MAQPRILLVEDDRSLLAGMHDFLELSGYEVVTAENGLVALEELGARDTPPDLIVSDIMMPDMDGYEFLAAVREREDWVGVPFIFLTAKGTPQDVRTGKQRGADDYITKPFDVEDLLVAIDARLTRQAELEKLNQTELLSFKKRILTALNHEFRTSLSYIVAYSDMLISTDGELDREQLIEYLLGIHGGGERLMGLVEDFLLLAEIETGLARRTYELRHQTIPTLAEFASREVDKYRDKAQAAGLELHFRADEDLPPVQGDYEFLGAVFKNLIDNAIKFTKGYGSLIEVSLLEEDGYVTFAVQDDGVGVAPHYHDLLFDLFYQADRDKLEQQGVGAGLAIVKHIVELHGGEVAVESDEGEGATFVVSLPASA